VAPFPFSAPAPVPSPEAAQRQAAASVSAAVEIGADGARTMVARAQGSTEALRQAVTESATAATRGMVEINGRMFDLLRAQSDATFSLWRQTLQAGTLSEAVRAQTSGVRQAYEATASQWKDLAEVTSRVMGDTVRPLQSALTKPPR
jgi:hypothetical protein